MFASSHFSSVAWIQGENVGVADLSCRNQSEPKVWQLCKQERNLQLRHQINCQDKARRDKWLLIIHIPPGVTWSTNGKEMFDYRGTPSCRVPHLHLHTRPVEKWSRALGSDVYGRSERSQLKLQACWGNARLVLRCAALHVEPRCFVELQNFRSLWLAAAFLGARCLFPRFVFVCFHLACIVSVVAAFQLRKYCYIWDGERWVVAELPASLNGNAGVWMETTTEMFYNQFIVSLLTHSQIEKKTLHPQGNILYSSIYQIVSHLSTVWSCVI